VTFRAVVAAICGICVVVSAGAQQPTPSDRTQVIRVWAYDGLSAQLLLWEGDYRNLHPEVRFENTLHGASAVMAGLYNGVADVALMGREIWPVETMAYQWVYQQPAFGVIVATAGLHAPGQLFTPVVIVNAKNPIDSISLSQLDAIYGSDHRAAPANIRTWGELGVKGAWADKPIHPYVTMCCAPTSNRTRIVICSAITTVDRLPRRTVSRRRLPQIHMRLAIPVCRRDRRRKC
jgi:phosphate transport system substrate-binding protein